MHKFSQRGPLGISDTLVLAWLGTVQNFCFRPRRGGSEQTRQIDPLARSQFAAPWRPVELVDPGLAARIGGGLGQCQGRKQEQMVGHEIAQQVAIVAAGPSVAIERNCVCGPCYFGEAGRDCHRARGQ